MYVNNYSPEKLIQAFKVLNREQTEFLFETFGKIGRAGKSRFK